MREACTAGQSGAFVAALPSAKPRGASVIDVAQAMVRVRS